VCRNKTTSTFSNFIACAALGAASACAATALWHGKHAFIRERPETAARTRCLRGMAVATSTSMECVRYPHRPWTRGLLVLALCLSGCAHSVGEVVSGFGVITMIAGVDVATGGCSNAEEKRASLFPSSDSSGRCQPKNADPKTGLSMLGVGAALAVVGGALVRHRKK
jgi:hypothetical protein